MRVLTLLAQKITAHLATRRSEGCSIQELDWMPGKFAVAVLSLEPLDVLDGDMQLGPYRLEVFRDKQDKYGKHGFNIYRGDAWVAVIRWRKLDNGKIGWSHAFCWDNDKPGVFLWNEAAADHITALGEAVEDAISDLETNYDEWIGNLKKEDKS